MTKNAPLTETTSAAAASMSSKPNAHFLRRGTRATLELIHIERLTGRRSKRDWLLAGSSAWLERRDQLEREQREYKELVDISVVCKSLPNLKVWDKQHGCDLFCGRAWPCATCKDGLKNGDEVGVDCGTFGVPPRFMYISRSCTLLDDKFVHRRDTGGSCIPCITCEGKTFGCLLIPVNAPFISS